MSRYTDSFGFIKNAPIGSCIYDLIGFDKPEPEFTVLVKEQTDYLSRIGKMPIFVVKYCVVFDERVALIPFLFSINGDDEMIYEMWINYWTPDGHGQDALNQLITQDVIKFIFFNEKKQLIRTIQIKNDLKDDLIKAQNKLKNYQAWSMNEFEQSRNKFLKEYPTVMSLFKFLSKVGNKSF